uniref:U6 snRNA phosphodiesterase n=1 Tax=Neolamprologus brichardi TaxID=32507 RepID=A0A3Q4GVM2_NEOBR
MLVGYSSSSSEEDGEAGGEAEGAKNQSETTCRKCQEEDDGLPKRKKPKTEEESPKSRLPLPGCVLAMFPDEVDSQTEDSSLHGGRIRSFKHERGNWASYVYFPYHPEEEFGELLDGILSAACARGVVLTVQDEFHLSLSQTVVLRHHWIQPKMQLSITLVTHLFWLYCSSPGSCARTFLGMEVSTGHAQLLELIRAVDRTMTEFRLETFYKDPSFHVSLAWCVGDQTVQMEECMQELQSLVDDHEDGPFVLRLDCSELRCRTGNKTFRFPLES